MSTLKADTIVASDGTSPVTLTKQYTAKSWCNFIGTGTVAIRDSGNTSSITDNSTGTYTNNFANNMANINYSILAGMVSNTNNNWTSEQVVASRGAIGVRQQGTVIPTTSSYRFQSFIGAGTTVGGLLNDFRQTCAANIGDLA